MNARGVSLAALCMIALAACRDGTQGVPAAPSVGTRPRVDPAWVSGAARAAVDANGRFVLPRVAAPGEIDEQRAVALTTAWLNTFGAQVRAVLEEQHGRAIDIAGLRLCDRPYYAASSYGTLASDLPEAVRQLHGAWWLVTLCNSGGEATVSLAVSALATNVAIGDDHIRFPLSHGMEFVAFGIPQNYDGMPISAEQAAGAAFNVTGVPVTAVPELVAPPRPRAPYLAQWRLVLAQPVSFRSASGGSRASGELYVRYAGDSDEPILLIASATQPADVEVQLAAAVPFRRNAAGKLAPVSPLARTTTRRIPRAADRAVTFERVTATREEARP